MCGHCVCRWLVFKASSPAFFGLNPMDFCSALLRHFVSIREFSPAALWHRLQFCLQYNTVVVSTGPWNTFALWTVWVLFPCWAYAAGKAVGLSSHETLVENQMLGKMRKQTGKDCWEKECWHLGYILHIHLGCGEAGYLESHLYCSPMGLFSFSSSPFSPLRYVCEFAVGFAAGLL